MKKYDYEEFAGECLDELNALQEQFKTDYNLTWYEKWFYEQATGLLTFSTDEKELHFRYFDAGSFSTHTNTWKWAWDNESILENVKRQSYSVRDFGAEQGFDKLTEGYFESDESEAWELTAIALRLSGGIAAYRPVSGHLQHFFVITGFVSPAEAKKIKDRFIKCADHEYRRRAFVCHHLMGRKKVGFEEAFETYEGMDLDEEDDLQAWCSGCEEVREKTAGWNDESMAVADIKVVCEGCYFDIKELNLGHR